MMLHKVFLLACLQQGVFLAVRIVHSDRFLFFFFFFQSFCPCLWVPCTLYLALLRTKCHKAMLHISSLRQITSCVIIFSVWDFWIFSLVLNTAQDLGFFCSQRESKITWQTFFLSSSLIVLRLFSHKKETQFEKDFSECSK